MMSDSVAEHYMGQVETLEAELKVSHQLIADLKNKCAELRAENERLLGALTEIAEDDFKGRAAHIAQEALAEGADDD